MKNRYTETPLFHIAASAGIVIFAILVGGAAASKIANTGTSSNTVSVSSAAQETTRASSVAAVVDDGERLYELASAYESTGDYAKALDTLSQILPSSAKYADAIPNCELKYSFNNTDYQDIPKCFDTVVVGKRYLRSKEMRHQLLESGYNLVLLLNNGCSFTCPGPCRNGTECRKIVAQQLLTSTPSELYALESFFPEELTRLLETDSCSDQYRFKLNTRPLGLTYTRRVLEAYLGHFSSDELIEASPQSYGLFEAAASLFSLAKQFDFQEIKKIKSELPV